MTKSSSVFNPLFKNNYLYYAISPSIARLINMSFSTGKFPLRWKTAKVTPLFKSGEE